MPGNTNYAQNNRSGGSYGNREQQRALPPVKIDSFYEADGKTIKPDLFEKTAEAIADTLFIKGSRISVSITQLRRLFDEVKRFQQILEASPDQWVVQKPYIKMIKSKASYTVARAKKTRSEESDVYENLGKFIGNCIDLVETAEQYQVFVALFEAVYGFYYGKNPKNEK
jgi:CRISPR-associated protein Csm2